MKFLYGYDLGIDTTKLTELSALVERLSGVRIPRNKPWVGPNAFTHESGIHIAAILNEPRTYECIAPELVGNTCQFILGKHSGTRSISYKLSERNMTVSETELKMILEKVKKVGEAKGQLSDDEFWEIAIRSLRR